MGARPIVRISSDSGSLLINSLPPFVRGNRFLLRRHSTARVRCTLMAIATVSRDRSSNHVANCCSSEVVEQSFRSNCLNDWAVPFWGRPGDARSHLSYHAYISRHTADRRRNMLCSMLSVDRRSAFRSSEKRTKRFPDHHIRGADVMRPNDRNLLLQESLSAHERVNEFYARLSEIGTVMRSNSQIVDKRGCRDQAIFDRHGKA